MNGWEEMSSPGREKRGIYGESETLILILTSGMGLY